MGDRAQRPFWLHQLSEYLIGVALIATGFQDPEPLVPAVAGIVVLINASLVRGPFGAFKLVGRRFHRWLDLVVIAGLVFAAVQPWVAISEVGRLITAVMAIPMAFLWWYTDWGERSDRRRRRADAASATSEDIGRSAGRTAANAYLAGKRMVDKRRDAADD